MGILIHEMGVKPQIERVGLEEVVVDQGNEAIHHSGSGENRRQSYLVPANRLAVVFHFNWQKYKKSAYSQGLKADLLWEVLLLEGESPLSYCNLLRSNVVAIDETQNIHARGHPVCRQRRRHCVSTDDDASHHINNL